MSRIRLHDILDNPLWLYDTNMLDRWFNHQPAPASPAQTHSWLKWCSSDSIPRMWFLAEERIAAECLPEVWDLPQIRRKSRGKWRMGHQSMAMNHWVKYGYGSIPINTIFRGMNIHLPAILMFTRGTRFWHTAICKMVFSTVFINCSARNRRVAVKLVHPRWGKPGGITVNPTPGGKGYHQQTEPWACTWDGNTRMMSMCFFLIT